MRHFGPAALGAAPLLLLLLWGQTSFSAELADEETDYYSASGEVGESQEDVEEAEDGGASKPSSVYVMEHGFLASDVLEWLPRGTLVLSGTPSGGGGSGRKKGGGLEARLSDAKEFVQLRAELPSMMTKATSTNSYYAVRMYSPENPKRVLQAAIPAKLLADHFEDWHDILEVTVGASGLPVALSYRVRHTLGLALFDHTQVHLSEPARAEGPRIPPRDTSAPGGAKAGQQEGGGQGFLRKYWWVIIIGLVLLSSGGDDGSAKGGSAAVGVAAAAAVARVELSQWPRRRGIAAKARRAAVVLRAPAARDKLAP